MSASLLAKIAISRSAGVARIAARKIDTISKVFPEDSPQCRKYETYNFYSCGFIGLAFAHFIENELLRFLIANAMPA